MLFPIGDDNQDRHSTPYVNYLLIAINIIVFVWFQNWGRDIYATFAYATVPGEILSGRDIVTGAKMLEDPLTGERLEMPGLQVTPIPVYLTLISSMFMHGGLAHLGGNMLYLWIFGDNVEHALGHRNYLLFYLLCGILASLCHVFTTSVLGHNLLIPSLGASGAIAAVLGAYILLFPGRRVHLWIFISIIAVPALLAVGLWFVLQILNGLGTLGGEESAGVAYAAHIGGFVAGLVLVRLFAKPVVKKPVRRSLF